MPCAGGKVLGQLGAHGGVGDDAVGGDQSLDLAANVRGIPRRAAGGQPGQDPIGRAVPMQRADRSRGHGDRPARVAVAQAGQLRPPAVLQVHARLRDHLVRAAVGPRPRLPRPPQGGAGVFAGMRPGPLPFVSVDVPRDLRRPDADGAHVVGELQ